MLRGRTLAPKPSQRAVSGPRLAVRFVGLLLGLFSPRFYQLASENSSSSPSHSCAWCLIASRDETRGVETAADLFPVKTSLGGGQG